MFCGRLVYGVCEEVIQRHHLAMPDLTFARPQGLVTAAEYATNLTREIPDFRAPEVAELRHIDKHDPHKASNGSSMPSHNPGAEKTCQSTAVERWHQNVVHDASSYNFEHAISVTERDT